MGAADVALAKSLVAMSEKHLGTATSIPLTSQTASSAFVLTYEALREVCEAICAKEGNKVYSHEAFTAYLREVLKEERIAATFDRLRKLRNGINYYGEEVEVTETEAAARDVKELVTTLKRKYLSDL